ncbi:transient receptor potential cation channel subfamily V member 6 isoform X6 [Sebastes fasciatus]
MRFFLDRGSDLLRPDQFGVTALHVASALDYQDMVRFLLDRKADPEARTLLDQQSPLHYAAKNDAVGSIRLLLQAGASISCTDYKHRTPLQLAASLERSEAARVLLELGAEAGMMDSDGQLCITALIGRMSPVVTMSRLLTHTRAVIGPKEARLALSQFHVTDRMTRQQYYYLNLLEPEPHSPETNLQDAVISEPTSPLEVVVHQGKLDLIMNPVFLKLIQVKWNLYGRLGAWLLLILNFLFNVSWTTVAISVSVHRDSPHRYVLPQDWWRVLLMVLALLLTLEEVLREVQDILRSRRKLRLWRRWAERRIHDDLCCSHPMWPQERVFLLDQNEQIHRMRGSYSQDLWNVFDWLVYSLLTVSFSVHVADVFRPSVRLHAASLRLFSVTVVFLWLRLMKHVRAFRLMGPFIVMLGSIIGDVMRFLFLYAEIFIPYACSFWIIFGGSSSVPSMQSVSGLLYSLYRITLVDEYEYAAMVTVDAVMAPLLCGTFLAASSILCVNLLIALLTDTFQRVHDNSQANAVMQQATVILQVDESMPFLRRFYDNRYISNRCAPLADAHDDDITTNRRYHDEMGRITAQIKETLDQFLVLQRDVETLRGSGVQTEQNPELQNQTLPNLEHQNQTLQNPEHQNQTLQNQELQNQTLQNPELQNQTLQNPELKDQTLQNPELQNQTLQNPELKEQILQNQELQNQELQNQTLKNQELQNQTLQSQELQNQTLQNLELHNQTLQNHERQNRTLQNQELQAIRAELEQLRILVQQLVQNRTDSE